MQKVFGIVLRDSDIEIMDDESPEKVSLKSLQELIFEAEKRIKQNPNIKQINIYSLKQGGQRILDYKLCSELKS
jgi:hypothetical protein